MRISDWSSDVCSSDLVVALNMVDLAKRDGLELDPAALSRDLGVPVIPTIAVRKRGLDELRNALGAMVLQGHSRVGAAPQDSPDFRSEEHTSALQSLMRISYADFCLKITNHRTNAKL